MSLYAGKGRILLATGLILAAGLGACAATAAMLIGKANIGLYFAALAMALLHLAALAGLPVVLPDGIDGIDGVEA